MMRGTIAARTDLHPKLYRRGTKTASARALHGIDPDWHAPVLLAHELTSVFAQFVRQGASPLEEARATLDAGLRMISFMDHEPAAERVLQIAVGLELNAYDACYLAAAEALGCTLVSDDSRLLRVAPELVRPIASLLSDRQPV
jgi:predicted nucleic acid-binding protein